MTNFEKIQIMEPHKLAMFLVEKDCDCSICIHYSDCKRPESAFDCIDGIEAWLEGEHEDI